MTRFSYRLALTSILVATSLAVWWTAAAAASRYIDRPGTGGASHVHVNAFAAGAGGGGFDWGDAGIGAATTVGLSAVAGGAWVLLMRRRRSAVFS
jgi:LPXTG-motif cell wall-anchored protein